MGGTASAQLIMVAAAPLLTRLYNPQDFGLLAVYSALLALFSVNSSLRYQLAIPLPACEQEAADVVVLSLICVVSVTLLTTMLVFFTRGYFAELMGLPSIADYLWLLPVGVAFVGAYQTFNYWALRRKAYRSIASTRIKQTLTTLTIQLLGYKTGALALIAGQAGGQGMGSYTLAKTALARPELREWRWPAVWTAAKRYRKFPYFSTWDAFFNTAGAQLPPLMFAALFSTSAAGLYALADRVLAVPMAIVGDAVGKVFLSSAAEAHRAGRIGSLVLGVHKKLVVLALPPTLVLFIAGPQLFVLIFGEEWQQAGVFAKWMAPWLYVVFVTSPLSTLFAILEKQRQGLVFQVILISMRVAAISLGAFYEDVVLTVILFSLASTFCWFFLLIWIFLSTGNSASSVLKSTGKMFLISNVCVSPLWASTCVESLNVWWVPLLSISCVMILIVYLKQFRSSWG